MGRAIEDEDLDFSCEGLQAYKHNSPGRILRHDWVQIQRPTSSKEFVVVFTGSRVQAQKALQPHLGEVIVEEVQ